MGQCQHLHKFARTCRDTWSGKFEDIANDFFPDYPAADDEILLLSKQRATTPNVANISGTPGTADLGALNRQILEHRGCQILGHPEFLFLPDYFAADDEIPVYQAPVSTTSRAANSGTLGTARLL